MIWADGNNRRPTEVSTQKMRERVWRYGPVALWMAVIFFASTNSMSASNTSRFVRPLLLWLSPDISEQSLTFAHFMVRKCAHFTEYAVLALLAARAFLTSSIALLRHRWLAVSFVLVATYALLDEYHQTFASSRTGSIHDSFIDIAGGAAGLVALTLCRTYYSRRKTSEITSRAVRPVSVSKPGRFYN